jgi:AraC-like DNA-binding protein
VTYWQGAPDPHVAGVVSRITFSAEDTPSNEVFRVLPDGGTDLLLSMDERSGHAALEVFGVKTTALLVRDDSPVQKLAFHLRPSAARRVLGVSAAEVRDRSVSLATLWGRRGELLLEQLVTLRSWRARRALVATVIASLDEAARGRAPLVERALVLIDRSEGRIAVEALARRLGADSRTLERAFREDVGVSPKVYTHAPCVSTRRASGSRRGARQPTSPERPATQTRPTWSASFARSPAARRARSCPVAVDWRSQEPAIDVHSSTRKPLLSRT